MCEACVLVGISSQLALPATSLVSQGKSHVAFWERSCKDWYVHRGSPDVKHSDELSDGKSGITREGGDRRKRGH